LCVWDRIEASSALVFGGPLLGSGDGFALGILASMLYALKKLPVLLVPAGIFVIILVAHGSPWNNEETGKPNVVLGKTDRVVARLRSKAGVIKCL
jgi:hypothetical protein